MGKYGKRPQIVMTTPILEGTDARIENGAVVGKKMSKSADNFIGIQESPESMFRKAMQIDDDVVFRFFDLLSRRSNDEIAALKKERATGRSPLEIKSLFAREMVERFHGSEAAERATREFERVYAHDGQPENIESAEVVITTPTAPLGVVLARAGLAPTTNMANAVIQQGGVVLDGKIALEWKMPIAAGSEHLVRFGSKNRRWKRIRVQQKT